jgi:protein-S-isoprenylcysteine O-methyltransferase Ste14
MGTRGQALIVVPLIIGTVSIVFAVLGYLAGQAFGLPVRLHMPIVMRVAGLAVLAFGFLFMGWIFKYRRPFDILLSTYMTMLNACRGSAGRGALSRTEPLVIRGPHRYVRNPLYFAVVVLLLGWWLLLDYTFLLFMSFLFFLWFTLVVIRFEEQELRRLFGEEYEAYVRKVPMIVPSLRPLVNDIDS